MSASDALSGVQFVHHTDLAGMYSHDFMPDKVGAMGPEMRRRAESAADEPKHQHPSYRAPGAAGMDQHIAGLQADIAKNGMHTPIKVWNNKWVVDGHHRAQAALNLKMDRIPIRHVAHIED